ncbi:Hypothetical predicted protein [Mytilus galloprovincialis]|uniref:Uncharacterized protein n=1 Tax=Mytilus galloprovincialis TaxID=29158 RepID=A0A8B6FTL7_MYTGA|nr:Hypothetical predicted protein [Mytilus galloprovincialis]
MIDNNTNTRYLLLLPDNHIALSSANCDIAQYFKLLDISFTMMLNSVGLIQLPCGVPF